LDAQGLIDILAVRWHIEIFFEYDKDLLGSDHYQQQKLWAKPYLTSLLATSATHLALASDSGSVGDRRFCRHWERVWGRFGF